MRRTLFILIGVPALLAVGARPVCGLSAADLQKQLAAGGKITVIDIRQPSFYGQDHIPGAINIPASLCPYKSLPPIGQVVVCGDGLGGNTVEVAAAALAKKPGLKVEVLEGGYAAWKSSQGQTTRGAGLKHASLNYINYAQLKTTQPDGVVLFDLRKPVSAASQAKALAAPQSMTDLTAEFPGMKQAHSFEELAVSGAGAAPLIVLIDNGDGTSEKQAQLLKASGTHNYVILTGGELILGRKGQAGLQRRASSSAHLPQTPSSPGGAN